MATFLSTAVARSAEPAGDVLSASERTEAIAAIATSLETHYVDEKIGREMARALRRHARRGDYAKIEHASAFTSRLTDDLRAVSHDKHLWVGHQPDGARDEPVDGPSNTELDQWREAIARDNFSFDKVERMPGNIGYLKFRIFVYPHLGSETAATAMNFVAHTDALIVDLRDNIGGEPAMVAFMLSYLFDTRTHLSDIVVRRGNETTQYWTLPFVPGARFGGTKPVFVLTSAQTFSAAEDYAYALQTRHRARIVGERTGGGAHPARAFKVSEHLVVSIPYARSVSPITGRNWEGTGVVPDIAVPAADALTAAYRAALQTLAESAQDDGRRAEYENLLKP